MAEATLMEKVSKLGAGVQPTTATGAAAIGGTPQQQAMAGSGAAKKKVLKEQTLGGQERLAQGAPAQATTGQSEAAAKAERMAAIGGSSATRIESAINKQINTFAPANQVLTAQADETALSSAMGLTADQLKAQKDDQNSKYNRVAKLIADFAAAPNEATRNTTLNSLVTEGIPLGTATTLLQTTEQAITGAVTQEMAAPVTMATVDLKGLVPGINNLTQLAAALGMKEADLANVSVSEFPAIIQDIQQKELAQADSLRAQIASLPPGSAQAQILGKQLQQVEQVGLGAAEENVDQAIAKLNTADEFMIGAESFTAEDLLGSEELTPVITDWLNAKTPEEREKIIPTGQYAGLVDWLTKNEKSLSALAQSASEGTKKAEETTANVTEVTDKVPAAEVQAITGVDLTKPGTTQADVDKAQKALDATGIGQLINEGDTVVADLYKALPEDQKALARKMSKEDLKAASEYAKLVEADPDLAELAGVTVTNGMVLDKATRDKIKSYKDATDLVKDGGNELWLEQDFFKKLKPEEMRTLARYPHRYRELQEFTEDKKRVNDIGSLMIGRTGKIDEKAADRVLDAAVGYDVKKEDIESQYAEALKWAAKGDPNAQKLKEKLEEAFGLSADKPKFTMRMLGDLRDRMREMVATSSSNIVSGKKTYREGGIDVLSYIKKTLDAGAYKPGEGSLHNTFSKQLEDNTIDNTEIAAAVKNGQDADLLKLIKGMPDSEDMVKTFYKVKTDYHTKALKSDISAVTKGLKLNSIDNLIADMDKWDVAKFTANDKNLKEVKKALTKLGERNPIQAKIAKAISTIIDDKLKVAKEADKKAKEKAKKAAEEEAKLQKLRDQGVEFNEDGMVEQGPSEGRTVVSDAVTDYGNALKNVYKGFSSIFGG